MTLLLKLQPTVVIWIISSLSLAIFALLTKSRWKSQDEHAVEDDIHPHLQPERPRSPLFLTPEEKVFLERPSPQTAYDNLRYLTSVSHVAGTAGDLKMAQYVQSQLLSYGIPSVKIEAVDTLLNYPRSRPVVQLIRTEGAKETVLVNATMEEDIEESDATSKEEDGLRSHLFLGYSPSGDVTSRYVYANYGRPSDFELLAAHGVTVDGAIVIMRYGHCFRGLKVMNAQNLGALGAILYSDPADDGYGAGQVYPDGPWRSASSVQRGSVQFLSLCPGDPSRSDPRYGNTTTEQLCGYTTEELLPAIPVVPMSYGDAEPFLRALDGRGPLLAGFGGGMTSVTYHAGPSAKDERIFLAVDNEFVVTPVWNVVAVIPGALPPAQDQPVLLGNHRDAWVYGAADPNSGTAALLEVGRGLGHLVREHGWTPQKTVYLLSWSGEEYALIGSTAWAELNEDSVLARASAYLNVDTVVSGDRMEVAATPSLATLWEDVLDVLVDNTSITSDGSTKGNTKPLLSTGTETKFHLMDANINRELLAKPVRSTGDIGTLGSGSDYTAFLDRFGIPSLDFAYHMKPQYGVYHSIYDSFHWMNKFGGVQGQPGSAFDLMADAAKIWGLMALRLAESSVLPLDHVVASKTLMGYVEQVKLYDNAALLELEPLEKAVRVYERAASALEEEIHRHTNNVDHEEDKIHRKKNDTVSLNDRIAYTERRFLSPKGLPKRPYFRHVLQAPGLYLGYASEVFPGVTQACDDKDYRTANEQILVAATCVRKAANYLSPGIDNEENLV